MVRGSLGLPGCPTLFGNLISLVPAALAILPAGVTPGPGVSSASGSVNRMDDCVQRS